MTTPNQQNDSENHTKESIEKSAEFVTGVDFEAMHAMSEYHAPYDNCNNELWYRGMGKRLFYTDLLYNLTGETDLFKTLVNNYENGYNTMKRLAEKGGAWEGFYHTGNSLGHVQGFALVLKIFFTIRSSSEWNVIMHSLPFGASTSQNSSTALSS